MWNNIIPQFLYICAVVRSVRVADALTVFHYFPKPNYSYYSPCDFDAGGKKSCWKRVRRDSSKSNGYVPALVLKTTKTRDASRIVKPKHAFQTISIHPQHLVENQNPPKYIHGRSESFLSSSSSVWDTDCLVAADPRTTKVPSVLVRSARNELDTESDVTDDLVQCDPYSGWDLSSANDSSSDDTLICLTQRKRGTYDQYEVCTFKEKQLQ